MEISSKFALSTMKLKLSYIKCILSCGLLFVVIFWCNWTLTASSTNERQSTVADDNSRDNVENAAESFGSTGVRFSGEKVRIYSSSKGEDHSLLKDKASSLPIVKNLFPSPSQKGSNPNACEQWAVVTTIHEPNASINGVANLKSWCLVIVGDKISPDDAYSNLAELDHVFYLSALYQEKHLLENEFIKMMPFNSFARKNIGYLFAIYHGAQVIYDFDDDNVLLSNGEGTVPPPFYFDKDTRFTRTALLKYVSKRNKCIDFPLAFNPYNLMEPSHGNAWPRGFPIDQLQCNFNSKNSDETKFRDLEYSSIGVIQSLCNDDPDNNAIFRKTQSNSIHFTFDRSQKSLPLLTPSNAYSPYNAQATTHLYHAFWGLYLPVTVPGRITDIWRSYFTQRIMKDLGMHVIYTPPIVEHQRSAHDYLADFGAETMLYDRTTKLLEFLDDWQSNANTLPERVVELWIALYEHDYIGLKDVEAVVEWMNSLTAIGYKFPAVHISGSQESHKIVPLTQSAIEQQPYRSFPHFNKTDWNARPQNGVMKLIMMTKDEWPLLKTWVLVSSFCRSYFII